MSGGGFHVHGPHDHEVEHVAQHGDGHTSDGFASRIAVMTAILSTVGAIFSYQGGATQSHSMMLKNDAAIKKTAAANQWAYYQSKSSKQNLAELGAQLTAGEAADKFKAEAARYNGEKKEIQAKAEALDKESEALEKQSAGALHVHHLWAQAMTAIQVAIALAAITLLTRKRWLQWGAVGVSILGAVLAVYALMAPAH